MTEGRSTGIKKIIDAMAQNGSPKPLFDFDAEHTFFQVTLPVHKEVLKELNSSESESTPQVHPQVTPQVMNLLKSVEGEMSRDEIMQKMGLKDIKNFRDIYLNPAINTVLIALTIPEKPQSSKQKNKLTALGKMALKEQQ